VGAQKYGTIRTFRKKLTDLAYPHELSLPKKYCGLRKFHTTHTAGVQPIFIILPFPYKIKGRKEVGKYFIFFRRVQFSCILRGYDLKY